MDKYFERLADAQGLCPLQGRVPQLILHVIFLACIFILGFNQAISYADWRSDAFFKCAQIYYFEWHKQNKLRSATIASSNPFWNLTSSGRMLPTELSQILPIFIQIYGTIWNNFVDVSSDGIWTHECNWTPMSATQECPLPTYNLRWARIGSAGPD